jgi:hypothetical protein
MRGMADSAGEMSRPTNSTPAPEEKGDKKGVQRAPFLYLFFVGLFPLGFSPRFPAMPEMGDLHRPFALAGQPCG